MACNNNDMIKLNDDQANNNIVTTVNKIVYRRSADYKPNIWNYDHLLSLATEFNEQEYRMQAHKMKEEVGKLFHDETIDTLEKLELLDNIQKLGLATYFEKEIDEVIANFELLENRSCFGLGLAEDDIYATSRCFRTFRQYGCNVSQDMLRSFVDRASESKKLNVKEMLGIFEATHLAIEGENILEEARVLATKYLENVICASSILEGQLRKEVARALELPVNLAVEWFNVRKHIYDYEKDDSSNFSLLMLAKLNFNMVQAIHQRDLKDILRWWKLVGSKEECLSFTRNRVVESYLWATGVAYEPQYANLRKWLTKVTKLVIIIDDVYDIFGTLEELELFTTSVERWDLENTELLPETMKYCMKLLYDTVDEITNEILEAKGYRVKQYIQNAWIEFCKGLLVEARWYHTHYTPSLNEYLSNGWVTSCGPLLSIHVVYSVSRGAQSEEANNFMKNNYDLVYNTSMVIRLCNDQGTTKAEIERGDVATSIICYMREANVSEGVARKKISDMISDTWRKINSSSVVSGGCRCPCVKCITNMARVAHFIYHKGDGFGIQHHETRQHVLSLLLHPLPL